MNLKTSLSVIMLFVLYGALFAVGFFLPGMWQPVAMILFYMAMGQAFNIFLGMTGYVDFGYVAFMALGSYGMALGFSALQGTGLGVGMLFVCLAMGAVMAGLLSVVVGAIALRLKGAYFAIATIGVNEGFRYLIEGTKLWGGAEGIIISKALRSTFGREAANLISTFWSDVMLFFIAATAALVTWLYMHSRIGYALTALREDEEAAKVMGVNVTKYKILAFITSASLAGLIGATAWCLKTTYVFPEDVFNVAYTVEAIVIVILGGAGTLLGPVIGGLLYGLFKYWLAIFLPGFQLVVLAPIILLIIVAFPGGIVGMLKEKVRETPLGYVIS
jgi:branched-chain amino acid transport system permease protein